MTAIRIISQQLLFKYQFCRTPTSQIVISAWIALTFPCQQLALEEGNVCTRHHVPAVLNSKSAFFKNYLYHWVKPKKKGEGRGGGGAFFIAQALSLICMMAKLSHHGRDWLALWRESAPGSFPLPASEKQTIFVSWTPVALGRKLK